ncbi:thioredoxin-like protein [Microstroma glucosiphilum]|uniref:Thioredoxin-like protein n=1 Tax=Pseudomicrostroma glucosiphilum TaxID=1684307 RepID=A0A316UFF4_9BASI|nr:thioredoxin-like protein [Pseudomicrostroma glucosiphilum]PWN24047.1 thioredoxin-like protein [Pseudomicrostroma glucosiphilum]
MRTSRSTSFRIAGMFRELPSVLPLLLLCSFFLLLISPSPVLSSPTTSRRASDLDGGEHMVTLTANDFQSGISTDLTFVEFYSPWCGHCKRFAPTFKNVAEIQEHWAEEGFRIKRVNCANSGDVCESQKVTGYPSLFLYRNGQMVEKYKGDRSFEDLMSFTTARASDYRKQKEAKVGKVAAPAGAGAGIAAGAV